MPPHELLRCVYQPWPAVFEWFAATDAESALAYATKMNSNREPFGGVSRAPKYDHLILSDTVPGEVLKFESYE